MKQVTTPRMQQLSFKFQDGRCQYLFTWAPMDNLHDVAVVHGNTLLLKMINLFVFYYLFAIYNHHALLCGN